MNLTIIIPTKNRLNFFYKVINYYSQKKFKLKLLIIDSSSKKVYRIKKNFLAKKKKKNITLLNIKGSPHEVIKIATKNIKTKYVAQSGDDDFYILSGLKSAISFLEKNINYIGVLGETYMIEKSKKNIDIKPFKNNSRSIDNKLSYDRLMNIMFNYITIFFSVTRTEQYKQSFYFLNKKEYPSTEFYNELQASLTLVILGKFKKIKNLLLLRTVGHKRIKLLNYDFKNDLISLENIFKILNLYSETKYSLDIKKIWIKKILIRLCNKYKFYLFKNTIKLIKLLHLMKVTKTLFQIKKNNQYLKNKNIIRKIISNEILKIDC